MLVTGDVNADGHDDVATSNSFSNSGSILLGDGSGHLGVPQVYAADPFGLAADLGDLDGDGDLDWLTSSYQGHWRLNLNDGDGSFTFFQSFPPTAAASCSLPLDFDNDGDLDLAAPPAHPPGVPGQGAGSTPLTAAKLDATGRDLLLAWDTTACPAADYQILYGGGSQLPNETSPLYGLGGARCGIGTVSPFTWRASPDPRADTTRLLWFLIVANNDAHAEGSWGADSAGNERTGPGTNGASNQCRVTIKDLTNACGR